MRRWHLYVCLPIFGISVIFYHLVRIYQTFYYDHPPRILLEKDVLDLGYINFTRTRIPRVIHQTYRTHDIPAIWNATVSSVMEKNMDTFKYRRWSHAEMHAFVKENEPIFYEKTYMKYPYDIQRFDSFRYVLMYYIGGIYIDMDNGCNHPFKYLVSTLESLEPNATHLVAFPQRESFGFDIDMIISSRGHPLFRHLISHLKQFNHYYIFHFWTILLSAGPLYASIQERLFTLPTEAVIFLLDYQFFRPMFIKKENGFTWIAKDAHYLFYFTAHLNEILFFSLIIILSALVFIYVKYYKLKRNRKVINT